MAPEAVPAGSAPTSAAVGLTVPSCTMIDPLIACTRPTIATTWALSKGAVGVRPPARPT